MTRLTRRAAIAGIAASPILAVGGLAARVADPVLAAIAAHRAAAQEYLAACDAYCDLIERAEFAARLPQAGMSVIVCDGSTAQTLRGATAAELRINSSHMAMIAAETMLARTPPRTAEGTAALMRYVRMDGKDGRVLPSAADWRTRGIIVNDADEQADADACA